eukprot:923455_1
MTHLIFSRMTRVACVLAFVVSTIVVDCSTGVTPGSSTSQNEEFQYLKYGKVLTPIEMELSENDPLLQKNVLDLDILPREELEDLDGSLVVERGSPGVGSTEKTVFYDSEEEYETRYGSRKDPLSSSSEPNKLYEKRITLMTLSSPPPLAYQPTYDKNEFEKLSPSDSDAKQQHKLRTQAGLGNTKNDEDEFTCSTDEYDPFNAKIYKSFHIYHEPEKRITGCQKCLNKCIDAVSTGCSYIGRVTCCRESTDANQHEPVGSKTKRRRMHRSSVWARYGSVNTIY